MGKRQNLNRRAILKAGALGTGLLMAGSVSAQQNTGHEAPGGTHSDQSHTAPAQTDQLQVHESHGHHSLTVGMVDPASNGFDPLQVLVDFDLGRVSTLPNGQTLREYTIYAEDKEIEIAPGIVYPAWTFNGRIPGPTLRCTEGDRLRIEFINGSVHPHSLHFHGIHPIEMDGVPGEPSGDIPAGGRFVYEFDADPFGFHPYHCHVAPLKRHIHKGLYGGLIVDPKEGRPPAREFVMVMNAFDTNFDAENEIYAVNTVAFEYVQRPIPIQVGELVRIYLSNMVEFDLINSFHLHANMFAYYDHGTTLTPTLPVVDTISQMQGQRGIIEFRYKFTGKPMFHAHVSEFTELGWMGNFNVVKPEDFDAALSAVGLDRSWDEKSMRGNAPPARS